MNKVRLLLVMIFVSGGLALVSIGLLNATPVRAARAELSQPPRTINWNDWDVIPGRLIVTYRPARSAQIKQHANASGVKSLTLTPIEAPVTSQYVSQHHSLTGFTSILPDTFVGEFDPKDRAATLKALQADPDVLSFEPDRVRVSAFIWGTSTPNDPSLPLWGMTRIGAPQAWARQSATRASVRVAVMENGRFDPTHYDLSGQNSPAINNTLAITSHTTHVAGIIAATGNNGQGVAGVTNVELVALGAANSGTAFVQAVSWAVNNQVRIINMSFKWCGSLGCTSGVCSYPAPIAAEQTAINNALDNIVFVGSVGNDSCSTDSNGNAEIPASYDGVIGVSAIDNTDALANFSNFGTYIDLAGPGVSIVSTDLNNTTSTKSGTSMAAPHVAGSAAAILAIRSDYDIRSIPLLLSLTAEDIGEAGWDGSFGDGVVRVDRAVAAIADVYANSAQCGLSMTGRLRDPFCVLPLALVNTPTGGTLGLVRGSNFPGAQTITKTMTIIAVGGTATLGTP